jgi:hypothetical protein
MICSYAGVALGFEEADDRTRATLSQVNDFLHSLNGWYFSLQYL